ncbi:MAG: helix-turn-helix domain-containing protein [Bacteroidales bacterium]|jgi:HTH-type transcriptional regulator/antitoxin HigA|nr:helix-turn-helix domain-containing protein [Bacteroidales bacterium]MDY6443777.1 helix-turn-helix domain-containing protein [Bacteroidales bacterium]
MGRITEMQYQYALERIEDLLPVVNGEDPNEEKAVELSIYSDIVIEYEKEHFPIEKPTPAELIQASLIEKQLTQKELASKIGVSPSRVNDYVSGRAEPTLRVASRLCLALGIAPAAMLGL